jgi:hypothetical protein
MYLGLVPECFLQGLDRYRVDLNVISHLSTSSKAAKRAKFNDTFFIQELRFQRCSPAAHLRNATVASGCDKNGL